MSDMPISTDPEIAQTDPLSVDATTPDSPKKRIDEWKSRIDVCKNYRRKLVANWLLNIDMRRGKPFASQTDEDRIAVNMDWSLTKAKQAALFSQVPQCRVSHPPQSTSMPWVHTFESKLNDLLVTGGVESALDEELPDIINASGIGAILISYDALTQDKEIPSIDLSTMLPDMAAQILQSKMMPDGTPLPMSVVPEILDKRYTVTRISPADLLWPLNFMGSDFDLAPWIGRSGRLTWADAVKKFKLDPAEKEDILGDPRTTLDKLTRDVDKDKIVADEMVGFDELWYNEYQYDPAAKSYSTIHHLVFIQGKEVPVIDEPWKGQQTDQQGRVIGSQRRPLRALTLSYITDECIPPSDSAIGRPQVNELNKLRTQNLQQRERSIPIRWMDINRVDPAIQYALMKGTWQHIIPVQGQGDKVLGEVARSNYPTENFAFDRITKGDLAEAWSIGPNQQGGGADVDTKGEANIIESNFQTRIGRERAKVAKHFCSIAEVLGGLMCLYEDPQAFGEGFDPIFCKTLSYSILADSTVLLDSNQRLKRLVDFVNFSAKSGWLNIEPVLKEIATLSGLDPNQVITPPPPKVPTEPSTSIRFTGVEDFTNPLVLAIFLGHGQPPTPELIEQAKQLIAMTTILPQPVPPPPPETGPDGKVTHPPAQDPAMTPPMSIITPHPIPPSGGQPPPAAPPGVGEANPDWSSMPKINKRTMDGGENK